MALVNKRIIDLPERAELNSDDYTVVDGSNGGTAKYNLANMDDSIDEVRQSVTILSGTVTSQGQQLATTNQNVAQNTEDITDLKADLEQLEPGLSDDAKSALLNCFAHVAWTDEHGQDYYDALEEALYAEIYPRISAVYTPGTHVVYTDDTLDSLKPYIVVKYIESAEDAGTVIPSASYSLTGTLTEGTSVITAIYQSYHTAITIANVVDFYNIWTRKLSDGTLTKLHASVDVNQSNTSMYPSRACILDPYEIRRHICVERGKAPYYYKNQTNVASPYYPIPMPLGANHVKITMEPIGQYAYVHFVPYDTETNTYGNSTEDTRISWSQFDANGLEKTLDGTKQWFVVMNTKYDSAGSSYPVEPTEITIEFSEV